MSGETVRIPEGDFETPAPCWIALVTGEPPRPTKPIIRCRCGMLTGIASHHVHTDGRVTASFLHDKPEDKACGWHVFLILDDWTGEDFPPEV